MTHAVVLVELAGEPDREASALGALLGLATYDVTARILKALPKVVVQSTALEEAERVHSGLAARGHGAVLCDTSKVVASEHMVKLRRFDFDASGVWAHGRSGEMLLFRDIGAVVVAAVRTPVVRVTTEVQRRDETSVVIEHAANERSRTNVAYIFPNDRAEAKVPWLLEEQTAQYLALGKEMKATRQLNFLATVDLLRDHAEDAVFDERMVASPRILNRVIHVRDNETAAALGSDASLDVTVHALAHWLMRARGGPYRG
jgi:hypothetical protein